MQEQRLGETAITLTSFALLYPSGSSRSRRLRRMRTRTKNRFRRSWATFEVVFGRVADVELLALATWHNGWCGMFIVAVNGKLRCKSG